VIWVAESWRTTLERFGFNLFPALWCTGATVTYIASDHREVHVRLPLSLRTRNYFGTIFGGSMYAATDPIYAVMLHRVLGRQYTIWDKAGSIQYKKPGRTTLYAKFRLEDEEIHAIKNDLEARASTNRVYTVDLIDASGVIHATVEKTVYIRRPRQAVA
jgi:acyl-coenzyme A thioesterase PaaI-like protein